jgi:hypothetical protein
MRCHFDRSDTQPHRESRSGETRFSTSTALSRNRRVPGGPLMQSHRMSGPSRKARSTSSPNPRSTSPPKPCHFDRSNRQSHRLLRSGETRFSTSTASSRKQPSLPVPLKRHPERSLSQSHRERRSRRACPEPAEGTPTLPTRPNRQNLSASYLAEFRGAPFMQSHRMSGPSRKARSTLLTTKRRHFDRSNRHRLLRSGETRFSTSENPHHPKNSEAAAKSKEV